MKINLINVKYVCVDLCSC